MSRALPEPREPPKPPKPLGSQADQQGGREVERYGVPGVERDVEGREGLDVQSAPQHQRGGKEPISRR